MTINVANVTPEVRHSADEPVQYLRNAWYPALWARDLQDKPCGLMLLEEEVVLYRTAAGEAVALGNRCPHRFVELHRGKVVGDNLQCPYHGLEFDRAGACAHNPHGPTRPAAARVRSYPTVERHAAIWVWMGEADQADLGLIPDFSVIEAPGHSAVMGELPIDGDYQHYNDNLLDLSHTEYVHPNLLQPGSLERSKFTVRTEGETVHFIRISPEEPATGTFQRMLCEGMGGKAGDIVRTTHHIIWNAPAYHRVDVIQDWREKQSVFTQVHIPVPTTRGRCRLMFASVRDFDPGNAELDDYILTGMTHVLSNEDIPPIASQESYTRGRDLLSLRPALLPTDEAAIRARRILGKKIAAEHAGDRP